MKDIELWHGDCLEMMGRIPKESVSCVIADLPYGVTSCAWDTQIDIVSFWKCVRAIRKPEALTMLFSVQPFTTFLINSSITEFRYDLTWVRSSARGFFNAKKRPLRKHESVLIFGRYSGTYNPQMVPGPKTMYTPNSDTAVRSQVCGGKPLKEIRRYTQRYPSTVVSCKENDLRHDTLNGHVSSRIHPTQKPVDLLIWLIKTYTNPGDLILDPTAGSMTTAVAAHQTGRRCIAIEKDAEYYRRGVERVKQVMAKPRQAEMPL